MNMLFLSAFYPSQNILKANKEQTKKHVSVCLKSSLTANFSATPIRSPQAGEAVIYLSVEKNTLLAA